MAHQRIAAAAWRDHVTRFRHSGLSAQAYAEQSNITPERLAYWIRRLQREQPAALVPVTVQSLSAQAMLELRSASGWTMALPGQVDPRWLATLLRGLQ